MIHILLILVMAATGEISTTHEVHDSNGACRDRARQAILMLSNDIRVESFYVACVRSRSNNVGKEG